MNVLRKQYLISRYRLRHVRSLIEKSRLKFLNIFRKRNEELSPFWSIFLTFRCTANCPYCIQNYSFIDGRNNSPLHGSLKPDEWLRINDLPDRPETIIIQGGEPLLYNNLCDVLAGLTGFKQVQVITNLTLDVSDIVKRVSLIKTHKILFECSFHENAIDFETFATRALALKKEGLLGSVRMVDVDHRKTGKYLGKFADLDIMMIPLYQLGFKNGKVLGTTKGEASDMTRKPPVLCKTKLLLFSPSGDIYNCHTKLYWDDKKSALGNICEDHENPDGYYICHDYGFCNPCQIGYVDIKSTDEISEIKVNKKILHSNPPKGVLPSIH